MRTGWRSRNSIGLLALVFLGASLAACTAADYERSADRAVQELLHDGTERTLGGREHTVAQPRSKPGEPPRVDRPAGGVAGEPDALAGAPPDARGAGADSRGAAAEPREARAAPSPPRHVSLRDALEIAIRSNRDHIARKEGLYQNALFLTGTRYAYSPRVSVVLSYLFQGSDFGGSNLHPESHATGLTTGVAQVLPWGGEVAAHAGTTLTNTHFVSSVENSFSSSAGITLTQPLLRGAGREVAWERLAQAERSLVYAIRDFELFREQFSIDVASRFYDLVQQKQGVENQRQNLEGFVFGRKQAEALFSVGRINELEVLRARRSELTSQNTLIEAEESLRLALDRFRIFLGLPDGDSVDVLDEEPTFVPVDYDVESAVDVALENRLDWLNRREQLEDARRGVRIAKNGLLPDLALDLGYEFAGDSDPSFGGQSLNDHTYTAALTLNLPLQQIGERNAYRSAEITLANATRSVAEFHDELIVSVRSRFRELARRKQSLEIQTQLIADQERNVRIAQLRFEQGNFSNRDVVEAQQSLLDARNALIQEKVAYEIARLGLLRELGILFIDAKGMWKG